MKIIIRNLGEENFKDFLDFQEKREVFDWYLGLEPPEEQRKSITVFYSNQRESLMNSNRCAILTASDENSSKILGFMVIVHGITETFINSVNTQIHDFYILDEHNKRNLVFQELCARTVMLAKAAGSTGIKVEILNSREEDRRLFESMGFYKEMNRILKPVELWKKEGSLWDNFSVRMSQDRDRMFILFLVAENSKYLIPAGKKARADSIRQAYYENYSQIDLSNRGSLKTLIAEDRKTMRPAGFIMIDLCPDEVFTSKKAAYLYDISVHPDFWGRWTAQRLVREGDNMLHEMNYDYYYADCLQSNPRPLLTAIRTLRFRPFSSRYHMDI